MNNQSNIFLYDGSIEGLFTIVYTCFIRKKIPTNIYVEYDYSENLFDKTEYIETNYDQSNQILNLLDSRNDKNSLKNIFYSFKSKEKNKEIEIVNYTIKYLLVGNDINRDCKSNYVLKVKKMAKNVSFESHKMKGFIRFKKIKNTYLSFISPDNNILEIISNHFAKRYCNEKWVICDTRRGIASFYENKIFKIIEFDSSPLRYIKDSDEDYEKLWRNFYNSVTIKERKNIKCQINHMPKKYWKYLTEMEVK